MIGTHVKLSSAATSGNGSVFTCDGEMERLTFYITTDTGVVSAGAITIEEAADPNYAGTWSTMNSDSGGQAAITLVQGTTIARHYTGSFGAVRARYSTSLTGGATCTVDLFGYAAH